MTFKLPDFQDGKNKWITITDNQGIEINKEILITQLSKYVSTSQDNQITDILLPLMVEVSQMLIKGSMNLGIQGGVKYLSAETIIPKALCIGFLLYKYIDETKLSLVPHQEPLPTKEIESYNRLMNLMTKIANAPTVDKAIQMAGAMLDSGELGPEDLKKLGLTDEQIRRATKQKSNPN